jgi:hypothetical protein
MYSAKMLIVGANQAGSLWKLVVKVDLVVKLLGRKKKARPSATTGSLLLASYWARSQCGATGCSASFIPIESHDTSYCEFHVHPHLASLLTRKSTANTTGSRQRSFPPWSHSCRPTSKSLF